MTRSPRQRRSSIASWVQPRLFLVVLLASVTVLTLAEGASAEPASSSVSRMVVRADGRIGPFRVDVTTERQIRARFGVPDEVEEVWDGAGDSILGHFIYYACGRNCQTAFGIRKRTHRLSQFWSQSPRFVTAHGSHPGMRVAEVLRREGLTGTVGGCANHRYINLGSSLPLTFFMGTGKGRARSIAFVGPNTILSEPC